MQRLSKIEISYNNKTGQQIFILVINQKCKITFPNEFLALIPNLFLFFF